MPSWRNILESNQWSEFCRLVPYRLANVPFFLLYRVCSFTTMLFHIVIKLYNIIACFSAVFYYYVISYNNKTNKNIRFMDANFYYYVILYSTKTAFLNTDVFICFYYYVILYSTKTSNIQLYYYTTIVFAYARFVKITYKVLVFL